MQSCVSWCTCSAHPLNTPETVAWLHYLTAGIWLTPETVHEFESERVSKNSDRSIDKVIFIMNEVQLIFLILCIYIMIICCSFPLLQDTHDFPFEHRPNQNRVNEVIAEIF